MRATEVDGTNFRMRATPVAATVIGQHLQVSHTR